MTGLQPNHAVQEEFVAHIVRLCRESARIRSALRGATSRTSERIRPEVHAAVTSRLPAGTSPAAEQAFYTIASLIAARPTTAVQLAASAAAIEDSVGTDSASAGLPAASWTQQAGARRGAAALADPIPLAESVEPADLGVSLARATIANRGEKRPMPVSNAEKHLHLLSRQGITGIHRHLPAVVRRLHELDQQIDWSRLLADLLIWEDAPRSVARRWLQSFYRALPRDTHPAIQEVER
ncbi:type I-E CRISPR-associated protein Cse2/CasB [Actinoalloteichus hymeniacidonis]|uniref:CRISPR type I-E/ECOLI-associated protein CasB/Cse2 n=1 Tax=Actinoalloteichus hymeniacidonis TaxID=340345 RepID=A0AAC9N077_9PSEU|nr:type I-E CRISPR-associated protein Cse2/CasB [Actinoalloteichus hymeniacidonis]AOS64817.1 CRISPR type I-E/ECOLI-associated protein CasB/Cse2 [Actinoalloteichus hymeniacidonis]MBB5907108.1 CRISPR system Cascade subunit CasB [Actinoalloteichus hymeniacidonis]